MKADALLGPARAGRFPLLKVWIFTHCGAFGAAAKSLISHWLANLLRIRPFWPIFGKTGQKGLIRKGVNQFRLIRRRKALAAILRLFGVTTRLIGVVSVEALVSSRGVVALI